MCYLHGISIQIKKKDVYRLENMLEMYNTNCIPVLFELCRVEKIREVVNIIVNWREENSNVSPGILIETLVVSIISGRKPLWKLEEFWSKQDLNYLFSEKITSKQLNDDAYARALDKLSEVKMEELVSNITLTMLQEHNETIDTIHFDTTSKSVQGSYSQEVNQGKDFDINRGYSKDHRPDLKQFKIGAAVQQNGLPIMGELLSGNKSDQEWNPEAVIKMKEYYEAEDYTNIIFIGDSATVSSYESIKKLSTTKYISRIPETFKKTKDLKERAFLDNNWIETGILTKNQEKEKTKYEVCSYDELVEGVLHRFVVVKSSALRKKKENTAVKKIEKIVERFKSKSNKLSKQAFACEEDASREIERLITEGEKENLFPNYEIEAKESIVYGKKGRPKKNEQGTKITNYFIVLKDIAMDEMVIKRKIEAEGSFVLITTILDRDEYSDELILKEYKQQYSVEQAFRFLKTPVFLGQVFLKKKERVEALGYVFILVLVIASYLEYRVRKSLKTNGEYLHQPGSHKTQRPTTKTILEVLETVLIVVIDGKRYFQSNMDERIFKMIRWAGFNPEIYLSPVVW